MTRSLSYTFGISLIRIRPACCKRALQVINEMIHWPSASAAHRPIATPSLTVRPSTKRAVVDARGRLHIVRGDFSLLHQRGWNLRRCFTLGARPVRQDRGVSQVRLVVAVRRVPCALVPAIIFDDQNGAFG